MIYLKRVSLLFAASAFVLLTGLRANAFPVDKVVSNQAKEDYSISTPMVYDDEAIMRFVDEMNLNTPYYYGTGIVVSSVTLDQNNINVNSNCSPLIGMGLAYVTNNDIENSKQQVALLLYQAMESMEPDVNGNKFLGVLIDKNMVFNYNYYVQGASTPACVIKITAEYIERVGNIEKNGYYI
jgi:hypothetical protein